MREPAGSWKTLPAVALAAGVAAAAGAHAGAAPTRAVRLDCGTRVLAFVFLPGKRLVDVGDAAHRRLLVADRRDYVFRSTCRSALGRPALLRGSYAATARTTRLGCLFPQRVQLVVERPSGGVLVFATAPGSARALLRADLGARPRLAYDRRWCRPL